MWERFHRYYGFDIFVLVRMLVFLTLRLGALEHCGPDGVDVHIVALGLPEPASQPLRIHHRGELKRFRLVHLHAHTRKSNEADAYMCA